MTEAQLIKNLSVPEGEVDVVLDTDAYNEIDDQFALSYLLRSGEKLRLKALYAAPFLNEKSSSAKDGMEKSYEEIKKVLALAKREDMLPYMYRGSEAFMEDEKTPVSSSAASDLVSRALLYSPDFPLYIVAIGAVTNVASAILLNPAIRDNIVLVWLGGNAHEFGTAEFNMKGDMAAARVVFGLSCPLVQLPCMGVVSSFTISCPELRFWLSGKNALSDYLAENTIREAARYAANSPWTRVIWDVTAVAWLLNDKDRFMTSRVVRAPMPEYNGLYAENPNGIFMRYVNYIKRDALMEDLIKKLTL